jgi:EAL domain-containing protein (putative c-di-GMP-specific phosphodiesterase class I)
MGLHVSIDDFGTGYSSLSYLSHFPITTLKIDRAFVKDMEVNSKTAEITNAIIGLSRGLSLEVVAEGAESLEHVKILRDKGCDLVQGFYFSRPLPADEFEKILEAGYLYDED